MRRAPSRGWTQRRVRHPRVGQALMEFVVALVAVVVIVAALLQVTALSRERLRTIQEARARVATMSLSDSYATMTPAANLLAGWTEGSDGRPMSADDQALATTADSIRGDILEIARPEALAALIPTNPVTRAMWEDPLTEAFGLVRGTARSDPVELMPVVRNLLYRADDIRVEGDATGVWLKGVE